MFRNRMQVSACCRLLLDREGLGSLWTSKGPCDAAIETLEREDGLSLEQRLMLLVCVTMWKGGSVLKLGGVLESLHGESAAVVTTLVDAAAHGPEAVDAWLGLLSRQPAQA